MSRIRSAHEIETAMTRPHATAVVDHNGEAHDTVNTALDLQPTGGDGPLGRILGDRYQLEEIIGRGGMSTVYRAVDRNSDQSVAVKVFRYGVDLESTQRMTREVQLASSLRHSGVVRVLDAQVGDRATYEGCAYLVTELVNGPTLAERIKHSVLSEQQTLALGETLCRTLMYIHGRGVTHRDIKPANVLLPDETDSALSTPKLTDFGIALMVDSTRLTATGFTAGTANYLSPEQVVGGGVGAASDIYSLALILIEAMTGRPCFPGHGIEAAE